MGALDVVSTLILGMGAEQSQWMSGKSVMTWVFMLSSNRSFGRVSRPSMSPPDDTDRHWPVMTDPNEDGRPRIGVAVVAASGKGLWRAGEAVE